MNKYYDNWCTITDDKIILSAIKGYKLPFHSLPVQTKEPVNLKMSLSDICKVDESIKPMLMNGALIKVKDEAGQFISKVFTVPKPNGRHRLVINLKKLNEFVESPHFKMEDHRSASSLITEGNYLASVDLKDAYYLIPIASQHQKYLRFRWKESLYQYTCVPFGLNAAPRLFTKLLKPVFSLLRNQGYVSVYYLDDTLLIGRTESECKNNLKRTIELFTFLGLLVNDAKSVLIPCQSIKFLGFLFHTQTMCISLPDDKRKRIREMLTKLLATSRLTVKFLAMVIGTLVSAIPAVRYGQVYIRSLECDKIQALQLNCGDYSSRALISDESKLDCHWWLSKIMSCYNVISSDSFEITMFTDASLIGWGGVRNDTNAKGNWNKEEKLLHINELELFAVYNSLRSLVTESDSRILLRVDNTTAVAYINKYGGCRSSRCQQIAKKIWQWCEERNIFVFASYVNTLDNKEADKLSRDNHVELDFMLSKTRFNEICSIFGRPLVDLFASSKSCQITDFVSWFPDVGCLAVDAFTIKWEDGFYAFPPFNMISRVLRKIYYDNARGIVVAPRWPSQPWFPYFLSMAVGKILTFEQNTDSIFCPYFDRIHSLSEQVPLMAAVLSRKL